MNFGQKYFKKMKEEVQSIRKLPHVFQLCFSFSSNDNDAYDAANDNNKQEDGGDNYSGNHGGAATVTSASL